MVTSKIIRKLLWIVSNVAWEVVFSLVDRMASLRTVLEEVMPVWVSALLYWLVNCSLAAEGMNLLYVDELAIDQLPGQL